MKKLVLIISSIMFCGMLVNAQTTKSLSGTIIDKYGNPIPGAVVMATGGADNTTTDMDGNFVYDIPLYLESVTVKYPGMFSKRVSLNKKNEYHNDKLIVKMKSKSGVWFAEGLIGYSTPDQAHFGIMGGYLGNWGGYFKATVSTDPFGSGIVGVTKSIGNDFYFHLGTGIGGYSYHEDRGYYQRSRNTGHAYDFGIIKLYNNRMTTSFSITPITNYRTIGCNVSVGVGYAF